MDKCDQIVSTQSYRLAKLPEVFERNYLNINDYHSLDTKKQVQDIARSLIKGKLSMTIAESSEQTKDRNRPITDTNFVMASGSQFLENLIKSNSSAMKSSFEITQEMLTFSQKRFLADIGAWNAISACRNPGDLPAYQLEFATTAIAQYTDIASKLANQLISAVSRIAVPIREQTLKS